MCRYLVLDFAIQNILSQTHQLDANASPLGIAIQEGDRVCGYSHVTRGEGNPQGNSREATIFLLDYHSCDRHSLGCEYFQFLTNDRQRLKRIPFRCNLR
ncbi:hypothetical protein CDAR_167381 [Caerostris darwini]|uniref:Uncharacterized protein n=1 Tax=Caerostris darwini TaxID=1538125 RepID=A0AAV4QFX7_9ARAC|nr:hypothetical protein CDAR_167381 [Caerostris darwini]